MMTEPSLHRMQLLVGPSAIKRLADTRVLLVGLGGVGSWCAEGLLRSGVGHMHLVDSDRVCATNLNRQLQATARTVGSFKADALKDRLSEIVPDADIEITRGVYSEETADSWKLDEYDYVIDAIDSLSCKAELIQRALSSKSVLFSSMGAACKLDPSRIRTGSFWKIQGCPLARVLRKRLRDLSIAGDFVSVFSDEENLLGFAPTIACGSGDCVCPAADGSDTGPDWCAGKKRINGSAVQITGVFGLFLTSLVVNDTARRAAGSQ